MQNAGFACLLKDFESQVRRSLGGQHGFILSNPDHPGEIMFFLLGAGDMTATSIIKAAQSFFMNTAYPFHLGISREHPFPGRFSDSYTQAKNAFFCFYGDIASSSTAMAALPSMEKLRFVRKQNNCISWRTKFFPPFSSETGGRLKAVPRTGWHRFFPKGKFPSI